MTLSCCLICTLFLVLEVVDIQAQIIRGPANQAAFIGDTAIFNCSMDCSNQAPVSWYFTLPSNLKAGIVSPFTQPNQIKSIYGMEVSRRTVNECPQGGYIVEQFLVTASRQLNLMPVQCSTLSDGGCGKKIQVYFSITALLKVADIVPTITSTPSDARTSPTPSNIGERTSLLHPIIRNMTTPVTSSQAITPTPTCSPVVDSLNR
ncbi:hypothetical protein EMCRGX_G015707 [Ephydatia muelleri]